MRIAQGYKTIDGFILKSGEFCYVRVQDPSKNNPNDGIYKAHYMDETAKINGWDFTIKGLPKIEDADYDWEVIGVWKHNPMQAVK